MRTTEIEQIAENKLQIKYFQDGVFMASEDVLSLTPENTRRIEQWIRFGIL